VPGLGGFIPVLPEEEEERETEEEQRC
jgi:hypothetical protein